MDNATKNADEIIKETTKLFNKTRQASITKELMDIVNGAEAVK
jgi:F-type H+-transporting ATPase subunit gamma